MVTIYLFKNFNNYYNRRIKRYATVNEYIEAVAAGDSYSLTTTNFNPRDGVTTSHIFNFPSGDNTPSFAEDGAAPDYCLIVSEDGAILSRWFVMEADFNRGGQYNILLHRDTVADNYDAVISAPCFIEKATVSENDPAIYNSEDMTFNQIKSGEYPITDKSRSPWLVLYKAKNIPSESFQFSLGGDDSSAIYIDDTIDNFALYQYSNLSSEPAELRSNPSYARFFFEIDHESILTKYRRYFKAYGQVKYSEKISGASLKGDPEDFIYNFTSSYTKAQFLSACYQFAGIEEDISDLLYYNGLKIKTSDNKYYTCTVIPKQQGTNTYFNHITAGTAPTLWEMFTNSMHNALTGTPDNNSFGVCVDYIPYEVTLTEQIGGLTCDFNGALLAQTTDATYDIICLPYKDSFTVRTGDGYFEISAEAAMQTMTSLATAYSDYCYDVQLLPYCPIEEFMAVAGGAWYLDLRGRSDLYKYVTYEDDGNTVNLFPIMACPRAKFSGQSVFVLPGKEESLKIQNECDMYRISSPNYNGQFEFSPAKNRSAYEGTKFEFDCFYQPYQPYIHVAPIFNASGLYGKDFDDARGLICGGDFSLPVMKNKWIDYQVQNKNFQNIFDRQIQNMDVNNSIAMTGAKWSAASGSMTGVASGAVGGSMVGGIPGAAVGVAAGGAASIAAGIADIRLLKRSQTEAIDFAKDQFGYSLRNIQALPNTITKVSPFNQNNKVFPFVEFFTCSAEERQALKDKIKYNGMTVMRIGHIEDFLQDEESYIKGKIIRIEGIEDEYHMATTIAEEINKGVFIA